MTVYIFLDTYLIIRVKLSSFGYEPHFCACERGSRNANNRTRTLLNKRGWLAWHIITQHNSFESSRLLQKLTHLLYKILLMNGYC